MPIPRIDNSELIIQNFNQKFFSSPLRPKKIKARGFTLVELLVVLAVMGILAGIGLARYSSFSNRQQVRNAALELKSNLRKYQTYAVSGQKNPNPASSTNCYTSSRPINFYAVVIDDADTYHAVLDCGPPADRAYVDLPEINLPEGLTISTTCSTALVAEFLPINQGVRPCGTAGGSADITITDGTTYTVTITSSGDIYER